MSTDPEKQQAPPPYPDPQGQPPPQQQTSNVTVVTAAPSAVVTTVQFKDFPVTVTDSNGQQVQTVLEYKNGIMVWLIACLICWLTGLCCIALIPFFINDIKDVYHITPTDGKVVGVYKRL